MDTSSPTSGASLAGKIAVVTSGSKGIGYAIAETLTAQGASTAVIGRNRGDLDRAGQTLGPRATAIEADIRNAAQVQAAINQAALKSGGLDILINNAGVGVFAPVADMRIEDFQSIIETNLSGVFYCCRAAIPHMRRRGGGWIINISSLASKNPFSGGAAYAASKAALNAFSEALMQEVRYDGIRVSYVLPGSVATGFGGRGASDRADWKVQPEDVARVVLDLLTMPERSLPSRVELRPSQPKK
jgi:NAD(P)-dependent dehydrogenase (short-subunit alcohol dehydrogenase family)